MKRSRAVAILLVLVFVTVAAVLAWQKRKGNGPLVLSGTIEARDIEAGSLAGGRVTAVLADEGDSVEKGQPIVSLETDFLDLSIREQEAVVAGARANLDRVQAGPRSEELRRARIAWNDAERERKRLERLFRDGVVGAEQYDSAKAAADSAHESWLEATRGSRNEDIRAAASSLDAAEGRLAYLERQREEAVVKAPAAGVIEVMDLRPGDLVAAGAPVVTILEPGELWVRVFVTEPKLGLVRTGQEAFVTVDTFPGREFRGRVVEIRDRGEYTPRNVQTLEQRHDLVFGVKVAIDPAPELKPGMAALVRLAP